MTRIRVALVDGRPRVTTRAELLRAQPVHARPGWVRLGLLATTALLLGGDQVDLEVEVAPGARLELFDVAGTVAYAGRGRPASWRTAVRVGEGAQLIWRGEPFVLAEGADVTRSLTVEVAGSATALIRETVVLGRSGEIGGPLRNRTRVRVDGVDSWVEDQDLAPRARRMVGILGDASVIDVVLALGAAVPQPPDLPAAAVFRLPRGVGQVLRYLGQDLSSSPLEGAWGVMTGRGDFTSLRV